MTDLRFAVLFCVFLIQRAAAQTGNCQSELYISIDDLAKALNNCPGMPGLIPPNQGQQSCGCQSNIPSNQVCGCQQLGISQSSFSNQQCGCNQSQRPISFNSLPSISLGQSCGCNQASIPLGQPCGCNQPVANQQQFSNQASFAIPAPTISLGNLQLARNQQSCGCNQPAVSLGNGQASLNTQFQQPQASQSRNQIAVSSNYDGGCAVPTALLQAPPYGIAFAGENLLIDGAVQVCGNMPFTTSVELSGILPSSGSGCVQYVCNDLCA